MLTDAQRAFLDGLWCQAYDDPPLSASVDHRLYGRVAKVGFVSGHGKVQFAPLEAAQLIVTACHDAATWGKVIEAAKRLYQVRCEYVSVVRGGGDEETERDPIREAFANYEHASAALVNCALKVAAALKEGSDGPDTP